MVDDLVPLKMMRLYVAKILFLGKITILDLARVASALVEAGLGPNSKAGLYLNNSNEYLSGQNAIFKIGGVPINVDYTVCRGGANLSDEIILMLRQFFIMHAIARELMKLLNLFLILKLGLKYLMEANLTLINACNMKKY